MIALPDRRLSQRTLCVLGYTCLVVSVIAAAIIKLPSTYPGSVSDAIHYVWLGEYLIDGSLRHETVLTLPFPPLYPMLLGIFGGVKSTLTLHVVQTACFVALCIGLFIWAKANLSTWLAGLLTLGFAVLPITTLFVQPLQSELLFMAILLATLVSANKGSVSTTWALTALLLLTRTIGISIIPALVFGSWQGGSLRQRLKGAGLAVLPLTLWSLLKEPLFDMTGNYVLEGARPGIGTYLASALNTVTSLDQWIIVSPESGVILWLGYALSAAGLLFMLFQAVIKREVAALFVLGYLGIIAVWPFPAELPRFYFAVLPIVLVYCARLAMDLRFSAAGWTFVIALIAITILSALRLSDRLLDPIPDGLAEYRRTEMWMGGLPRTERLWLLEVHHRSALVAREIKNHVPETECVYSEFASWASFFAGVPLRQANNLIYVPGTDARKQLADCNYVLSVGMTARQRSAERHYILHIVAPSASPILTSFMEVENGEKVLAAALVEIGDQ